MESGDETLGAGMTSPLQGGAALFGRAVADVGGRGGMSHRQRSTAADLDPLADILSKLGLSEGGTVVEKKNEESAIHVMMEVLELPYDQVFRNGDNYHIRVRSE